MTVLPLRAAATRRRRRRWSVRAQVTVGTFAVALLAVSAGLVAAGPPEHAPRLVANLQGAISIADVVDIGPVVAPPLVVTVPQRPIDVPADPYAKETVVEIGRLAIPKLGVDQVLMHGVTLNNIDHGPSHWPGSAMPGRAGNSVIAGHRVTHSKPFRNVDRLVAGDLVVVTAKGVRATYSVLELFVVNPSQMEIVEATTASILTMFACHPPGSARQRIVVRAELIESVSV